MFIKPFSFEGRIRRTEYAIFLIIYTITYSIIYALSINNIENFGLLLLPLTWLLFSEGAKRCHDIDNSGWWQLIPFYVFVLIFKDGIIGKNEYGDNPKGLNEIKPNIYIKESIIPFSIADELQKMRDLLDNNTISQEEYEKQKEKLLNK